MFLTQGLLIGWLGVAAGVALGVAVATQCRAHTRCAGLAPSASRCSTPDVYYLTDVPSELHGLDVLLVAASALVVTTLATIYPALRAARVSPAEALRYE